MKRARFSSKPGLGRFYHSLHSLYSLRSFRLAFRHAPLASSALRAALVSIGVLALLALAAGGVRVLPWLLDPDLPPSIALPFARSVATLALEAAILVGWPVGWALAAFAVVERGEARVLATLGESPARSTSRLAPQALLLGVLLAIASALGARDATEPGRVVTELLDRGRAACDAAKEPTSLTVPFLGATWLCAPQNAGAAQNGSAQDTKPLRVLAGSPPGFSIFFTARSARLSPDLERVELDDAWLELRGAHVRVHATDVALRGLPVFARASSIAPLARAASLAFAAALSALAAVWLTLRRGERADDDASASQVPARLRAIALGAAGPLVALVALRLLERAPILLSASHARAAAIAVLTTLPIAAAAATLLTGLTAPFLAAATTRARHHVRRLLRRRAAARK